jgi:hypothetical protein
MSERFTVDLNDVDAVTMRKPNGAPTRRMARYKPMNVLMELEDSETISDPDVIKRLSELVLSHCAITDDFIR